MTIAAGIEADRIAYDAFLARSRQRSVFATCWWLDAATGSPDGWQALLVRGADGEVLAAWPTPMRPTRVGTVAAPSPYTPFLGPLLPDGPAGVARTSTDVDLLDGLATAAVGALAHIEAACMPEFDYWTPLAWHGFSQTSRTTWRIDATATADEVRAGMRKGTRSTLGAAERDRLVVADGDVDDLLAASAATFARQPDHDGVPARPVLERVARAALQRGQGEVRCVRTAGGELVSAGLFVRDDRLTYNLANGRIDLPGVTGAPTLLLWDAITRALARGTGFDFEGSMLRPVERFVRGFGGRPVSYSVVRRSSPAWERTVTRRRALKRVASRVPRRAR